MTDTILLAITLLVAIVAAIGAWRRQADASGDAEAIEGAERRLTELQERTREGLDKRLRDQAETSGEAQRRMATDVSDRLGALRETLVKTAKEQGEGQAKAFQEMQGQVQLRLEAMRKDSEEKLEKIRATVDEKLQTTLEKRLGESFKLVSERLEKVQRGLGEMQELASGVGDLKRVLTNVRTRGTFGEVQLAALLESVLHRGQYEENIATVPGQGERVEFAIRLPGRDDDGTPCWLPIDAKFPQEDFLRLQQAYEDADTDAVENCRKALRTRMIGEAKRIREKYISPPHTTDFAILFMPTEALYAEALRIPGLTDEMQTQHRIVPAGPTTLAALLNSLQMGFRTLAIEKRSGEVWKVLGEVKTEFDKFSESLVAVTKKLNEAKTKWEETTGTRTNVMRRKLRDVEAIPLEAGADPVAGALGLDDEDE